MSSYKTVATASYILKKVGEAGSSFGATYSSKLIVNEIWLDFSRILLTYLQAICRPWSPLTLSFLFLMHFSLMLMFQSNQTGPTSGTFFSFFYQNQFKKLNLFFVLKAVIKPAETENSGTLIHFFRAETNKANQNKFIFVTWTNMTPK